MAQNETALSSLPYTGPTASIRAPGSPLPSLGKEEDDQDNSDCDSPRAFSRRRSLRAASLKAASQSGDQSPKNGNIIPECVPENALNLQLLQLGQLGEIHEADRTRDWCNIPRYGTGPDDDHHTLHSSRAATQLDPIHLFKRGTEATTSATGPTADEEGQDPFTGDFDRIAMEKPWEADPFHYLPPAFPPRLLTNPPPREVHRPKPVVLEP